jgi:acetoin utilization deacetylase AcuC-like enzyme
LHLQRTGIVRDPRYLEHKTGVHHIEIPQRLETIYNMLDSDGLQDELILIPPRFASLEELEMVHTPAYIERILDTAGEPRRYLDPDTVTSERSCEVAFLAAGGMLAAVQKVMAGEVDNAFALVRPPGHHAERDRPLGFCLFNNVAIAAEYARKRFGLNKILIIDWDVHHPNGVQHMFYHDPEVLLFSTHRSPFFPGSGEATEVGEGSGRGFTVNVPLPAQRDDYDYGNVYRHLLAPIALAFKPQIVLVSAGFDTHQDDPIGGMRVTERGYARITDIILDIARQTCEGRVVTVLEGGYDLAALRRSVKSVLQTMRTGHMEDNQRWIESEDAACSRMQELIDMIKEIQKPYWNCF